MCLVVCLYLKRIPPTSKTAVEFVNKCCYNLEKIEIGYMFDKYEDWIELIGDCCGYSQGLTKIVLPDCCIMKYEHLSLFTNIQQFTGSFSNIVKSLPKHTHYTQIPAADVCCI